MAHFTAHLNARGRVTFVSVRAHRDDDLGDLLPMLKVMSKRMRRRIFRPVRMLAVEAPHTIEVIK